MVMEKNNTVPQMNPILFSRMYGFYFLHMFPFTFKLRDIDPCGHPTHQGISHKAYAVPNTGRRKVNTLDYQLIT